MLQVEPRDINLSGVNVRYVHAGQGPVVLLLHGLGASSITWCRNIVPLAQAGYTVLALDLPGHGDSDKPSHLNYDPTAAVHLIRDFIDALGVKRLSLVGSSAGGLIVGLFALEHPNRVDRLILVGSGGMGRKVAWFLRLVSLPVVGELVYQPWLHRRIGVARQIFYRRPPFLDQVLPELDRVRNSNGARHAALRSIRSSINHFGLREQRYIVDRLKDLPVPLLTVWGQNDIVIPVAHAETVRKDLPNSVVRVLPECGHWPHMEKAEEFNELLIQFLRGGLADIPGS